MMWYRRYFRLACTTAALAMAALALGGSARADTAQPAADDLSIGPGAVLTSRAADNDNGDAGPGSAEQFGFGLRARNGDRSILMALNGPGISLCSAHGPAAVVDFDTEQGNFPLQGMQCGRAFGMDVALDGCTATLEFHGFVHSDRSTRIYFGPMTTDVVFRKTGDSTGNMTVTIFTPKARIDFRGAVQSPTPIVMTTCH